MVIKKEQYDCFNIFSINNNFSFLHIEIEDTEDFYKKLFNYFFTEEKILQYGENNYHLHFSPTPVNYTKLYKNLLYFIDRKNLEALDNNDFGEVINAILLDEFDVENKDGKNFIRIDKYGKVGEYIFSCILSDYFKFNCVIPKVKLTTNFNMSVFGIDTLFYSTENNIVYFGESKISKTISNGIELLKKSIQEYQNQIENEFILTLSNRVLNCSQDFRNRFEKYIDKCISFKEFVDCANITTIGIPIFIAHGQDTDVNKIFDELNKLPKNKLCGLETQYCAISLPIINKNKMMATFTQEIRQKEEFYKNAR